MFQEKKKKVCPLQMVVYRVSEALENSAFETQGSLDFTLLMMSDDEGIRKRAEILDPAS